MRTLLRLSPLLLAIAANGCNSSLGTLTGKVTFENKPVVYGVVSALCSDGLTRTANIQEDGSYRLENLPLGSVQLGVVSPEPPTAEDLSRRGNRANVAKDHLPKLVDRSKWMKIPDDLGDPRKSGKTANVTAGTSTFDIHLP